MSEKKKIIGEGAEKAGEAIGRRVKKGTEKTGEALERGVKIEAGKTEKVLKIGAKKATEAVTDFEKGLKEGIEEEKKRIRGEKQRLP
jgi:hypothetical protein